MNLHEHQERSWVGLQHTFSTTQNTQSVQHTSGVHERKVKGSHGSAVVVDFLQQSHDFFAQAERSGVAGERCGVGLLQLQEAEEEAAGQSGGAQPHVDTVYCC